MTIKVEGKKKARGKDLSPFLNPYPMKTDVKLNYHYNENNGTNTQYLNFSIYASYRKYSIYLSTLLYPFVVNLPVKKQPPPSHLFRICEQFYRFGA
jgi:hypothetical protein